MAGPPQRRKTTKTRKKTEEVIRELGKRIQGETKDFEKLYLNRENGITNSDRIKGRYPQAYIKKTLADIHDNLVKVNNLLVKRKPDSTKDYRGVIYRPEKKTRAYKQFRGNEQIEFGKLSIGRRNSIKRIKNDSSVKELVKFKAESKNVNLQEIRKFVRIQVVNLLNLATILTGSRKNLFDINLNQTVVAKEAEYPWAKVRRTDRISTKVKQEIFKLLEGKPGFGEKIKNYLGHYFKITNELTDKDHKNFQKKYEKQHGYDKFVMLQMDRNKLNNAVREYLFLNNKPTIESCQEVINLFIEKVLKLIPTVTLDKIVTNLQEADSLKSLAYYRQRVQRPQYPDGDIDKMWDTDNDEYDPRLWTAMYVYRMKYIFKMKMENRHGQIITSAADRESKLKRFIHESNLLITTPANVAPTGNTPDNSNTIGIVANPSPDYQPPV